MRLVWHLGSWIAQREQLPNRGCLPRKFTIRVNCQQVATQDAADDKAVTLDGDNFVFFVEDCHSLFDADCCTWDEVLFERSSGSAQDMRN